MSWKDKAVALYRRFGSPVKFAAKLVLGTALPGGSAVVSLVEQLLDCVHETAKDQFEVDDAKGAAEADLKRVEEMFDVLSGDLAALTAQAAALEKVPDAAAEMVRVALATDERCRTALHKLDELARGFGRIEQGVADVNAKADQINAKIDELLRRNNVPPGSQPLDNFADTELPLGLAADREAFLAAVRDNTTGAIRERFARILDDLIRWTEGQPEFVRFRPRQDRKQATVTYCLAGGNTFWTAYPRKEDGAKLSVLDSPSRRVPDEVQEMLRREFARMEGCAAVAPNSCPTLSFRTLERDHVRNEVKDLLSRALASIGG